MMMKPKTLDTECVIETPEPGTKDRSKRVLMLSTALGIYGGAEMQIMLLSVGLRARGWAVKIVSLLPVGPLTPELEASDIAVETLGMTRGVPDPRAILALSKHIREFRPDIVHSHLPQANLLARVVRPFQPYPVSINTLHTLTMERMNGGSGRLLEMAHTWTDRWNDLTTVICKPAVQGYVERGAVPLNKITVLHNGINLQEYEADAATREDCRLELGLEGKFAWLTVGRLERAKDYPNLVRAFKRVVEQAKEGQPEPVLLICGIGSLESEIRTQLDQAGLGHRVRMLGMRRDIPRVMNAADGFVLGSYLEGLPLVLLQASAIGTPIVTTNAGGTHEAVMDGVNGFVVPTRDDRALANAMQRVMQLPAAERARMIDLGRRHIREEFEIERILDRWEQLYFQQLSHKGVSPAK